MGLILGMDTLVFTAWLGTILATILCILYGLYYQFFKKSDEKTDKDEHTQKKEAD